MLRVPIYIQAFQQQKIIKTIKSQWLSLQNVIISYVKNTLHIQLSIPLVPILLKALLAKQSTLWSILFFPKQLLMQLACHSTLILKFDLEDSCEGILACILGKGMEISKAQSLFLLFLHPVQDAGTGAYNLMGEHHNKNIPGLFPFSVA